MTRINVGVPVEDLHYRHLIAEHREIKRIPNAIRSGRVNLNSIPDQFSLGTGHVRFFYDKLLYLKNRYDSLYKECRKRGFEVGYYGDSWKDIPTELMNDYQPTNRDREIVIERINERLKNMI